MTDRFKFRAWADPWGKFVMSEEFTIDELPLFPPYRATYGGKDISNMTLMQSTGLKDKNGKLIYEGDILSVEDEKMKLQIKWSKNAWRHEWQSWDKSIPLPLCEQDFLSVYCEIIGNIYENPELLEADND